MSLRRILGRQQMLRTLARVTRGGGGDHHGPSVPPFARQRPPVGRVPEEVEIVWDDSVAPEAAIDYDAPHISLWQALKAFATMMAFIGGIYTFLKWCDPEKNRPAAPRSTVLSAKNLRIDLGLEAPDAEYEETP